MRPELMISELPREKIFTGENKESDGPENPKENSRKKDNAVTCNILPQEETRKRLLLTKNTTVQY